MEQDITFLETVIPIVMEYSLGIVGAIVTLIVGWIIAGWVRRMTARALKRVPHMDDTLVPFISQLLHKAVLIIVFVAVLNQFGVETTSIIAVLGAAGLAIGLALQGTLSNIAAGVMLMFLRPFKIGEFIDAGGTSGTIVQIGLFTTELLTPDGVYLIAPNSSIWNQSITNYSRNKTRRINITMGISYDDDIDGASEVLLSVMKADARTHNDPEPQVLVGALGASSVDLSMRCWTNTDDYWGVFFDLNKASKLAIEAAGYSIPYPQTDVHMIPAKES
ncbi:MAG: mechanosensitive ion channel [Rhodospirillales bacterium]|jgi:small conductance mechanosensitive channel|nr:mechanosensitive ion channel [Rhodospirillales bacterium]